MIPGGNNPNMLNENSFRVACGSLALLLFLGEGCPHGKAQLCDCFSGTRPAAREWTENSGIIWVESDLKTIKFQLLVMGRDTFC